MASSKRENPFVEEDEENKKARCMGPHDTGTLCHICGMDFFPPRPTMPKCLPESHSAGLLCPICGEVGADFQVENFEDDAPKPDVLVEDMLVDPISDEELLLSVSKRLDEEVGSQKNLLSKLAIALNSGRLSTDSLTYTLMLETASMFSLESLTDMRYSHQSKSFWKVMQIKFGSAALRYLSGWKCTGTLLTGDCEAGRIDPRFLDIIFAVPDEKVVRSFAPYGKETEKDLKLLKPGFSSIMSAAISESCKETSVCLSFDGKKITPGLTEGAGDVDLLGFEPDGVTLLEQRRRHRAVVEHLATVKAMTAKWLDTEVISPQEINLLCQLLEILTDIRSDVTSKVKKTSWRLKSLKEKAGPNYKESRLSFVISLLTSNVLEMNQLLVDNLNLIDDVCKIVCFMQKTVQDWCPNNNTKETLFNYCSLLDWDSLEVTHKHFADYVLSAGLRFVRQRSRAWVEARNDVKVTGSKMFQATGLDGLKALKRHYDVVNGKIEEERPSPEVLEMMQHGTLHEPCGVLTMCCKVLPVLFPGYKYLEVGGFSVTPGKVPIIISPDGVIADEEGTSAFAVEIKCPFLAIQDFIPKRYVLQVNAEMFALGVQQCLFVSFTKDTTRVFLVNFDENIFNLAISAIDEVFGGEGSMQRSPSRLPSATKTLKGLLNAHAKLLIEVKSLHCCTSASSPLQPPYTIPTSLDELQMYIRPECTEQAPVEVLAKELVSNIMDFCDQHLEKKQQILRQKASEMVAFVAADLDRSWSKSSWNGAPVCYFLKSYCLTMEVARNILEYVLDRLHEDGVYVPVISFDGQFLPLLNKGQNGKPQTVLQLQKTFWERVNKLNKTSLIAKIKESKEVNAENMRRCLDEERDTKDQEIYQQESDLEFTEDLFDDVDILEESADENQDSDSESDEEQDDDIPAVPRRETFFMPLFDLLRREHPIKWSQKTIRQLEDYFVDASILAKHLTVPEFKTVLLYLGLPVSGTKEILIQRIQSKVKLDGTFTSVRKGHYNPPELTKLVTRFMASKRFPKSLLTVGYAREEFPFVLDSWRRESRIRHGILIEGLEEFGAIEWFYHPQFSDKRNQLEVRRIDSHHLLTRTRSALNRAKEGEIGIAKRAHFLEVAESKKTKLKIAMMQDNLDMQSTDYALITFSLEVEDELVKNGYHDSAKMCRLIREWFEACDSPAVPALERCRRKLKYRKLLLELVDTNIFPPPGSHIKGFPKGLWESLVAGIESDLMLYSLARKGTYNQRANSSQVCEQLFGSLATMPSSHNGVPSAASLQTDMSKVVLECLIKQDPERKFPIRLSNAPVYPEVLQENVPFLATKIGSDNVPVTNIQNIIPVDHFFDTEQRRRRKGRNPVGISDIYEPAKGATSTRTYHRVDEGRMNVMGRMGFSSTDM